MDNPQEPDVMPAEEALLRSLVLDAADMPLSTLAKGNADGYCHAAALVKFAEPLVSKVAHRQSTCRVSDACLARLNKLQDEVKFALEHDDWLVSEVRARGLLDALIRGRQEVLLDASSLLPRGFRGVPLEKPAGKVNYRIYPASKLSQLLQFGVRQPIDIIKLAVIGKRATIERKFSELLGTSIVLDDGESAEPTAVFLRASVSRQLLIYTIGFSLDSSDAWQFETSLQGFTAVVFYAEDISDVCVGEGAQLLNCLMHVPKDNVVVVRDDDASSSNKKVDEVFGAWVSVKEVYELSPGLPELLRSAIYHA